MSRSFEEQMESILATSSRCDKLPDGKSHVCQTAEVTKITATKNPGDYVELDISDEEYREVYLKDGPCIRIENPQRLFFRKGGTTHRVTTADGKVYVYADPSTGKSVVMWKVKVESQSN